MAVIGSIRKRSTLLILIIGGALFAFIVGEWINSQMGQGVGQGTQIGEIDGIDISPQEFSNKYNDIKNMYGVYQPNSGISDEDFRRFAWNELVKEKVLYSEIENTGIKVSTDELDDMLYGDGALDEFKSNPQFQTNGVFDGEKVRLHYETIFGQIGGTPGYGKPIADMLYRREIDRILNQRKEDKYNNLIKQGMFATSVEAMDEYNSSNAAMDVSYVYKRYNTIPDSTISISDSEIKSYFNAHADESQYQQIEGRSVSYVSFPAKATEEDIKAIEDGFVSFRTNPTFTGDNDTNVVTKNNPSGAYLQYYNASTTDRLVATGLGTDVIDFLTTGNVGDISPVLRNGPATLLNLFKIKDQMQMPDSVKASHVLIAFAGAERANPEVTRSPLEAKQLADSLFAVISASPSQFEDIATNFSDGPTKTKQGDLGWFTSGTMAPGFNNYCFFNKKGDIGLVPTSFGFHIINIKDQATTGVPTTRFVQISKTIKPSKETRKAAYNLASSFMFEVKDKGLETFETVAKEKGYAVIPAQKMNTNTKILPGVDGSERIVAWAYGAEVSEEEVSDPEEAKNEYIVGVLTQKIEKGDPVFAHVKDVMKAKALNEKKAAMIKEEWNGFGSLEDIAELEGVQVQKGQQVKFSTSSISGMDPEPNVIGTLAGAEEGSIFFIDGDNGFTAIRLDAVTGQATGDEQFASQQSSVKTKLDSKVNFGITNALNKLFNVNDNLHEL